jgi:membrane protease subunit (stomatin/prohibitin family)
MGLLDKLRAELVDIVEWLQDSGDTLVHRFERYQNEIKYGAKLVVREGQAAVFVNEGKLADVFKPGTYTLETRNLPILATLLGWKYGFHSPFKAEVYFVVTRQFTDLKWGTLNPIMLRDPEFGPLRLRAFGTYAMRVKDPGRLIREIVGTDGHFTADEITNQLRNLIITRFTDLLAESRIAALDLARSYDEISQQVTDKLQAEFDAYGIELMKFLVENISLPPAVEEALDKRSSIGIVGNLSAYTQFQAANAMEQAAKNPGGMMGGVMGMGMGVAMAGQMGQAAQAAPPPVPGVAASAFFVAIAGRQAGPFDMAALQQQAAGGQVRPDSLVWRQGMSAWAPAAHVPELANLFGAVPPPLPPGTA